MFFFLNPRIIDIVGLKEFFFFFFWGGVGEWVSE